MSILIDVCPKCGSQNVWVGNFPLSCNDCGWHYCNLYPCYVCNEPSTGFVGINNITLYSCSKHSDIDKMIKVIKNDR